MSVTQPLPDHEAQRLASEYGIETHVVQHLAFWLARGTTPSSLEYIARRLIEARAPDRADHEVAGAAAGLVATLIQMQDGWTVEPA